MKGLVNELKRRSVFRVGGGYLIVAWLVAQVAELALDSFAAPDWVMKTLLLLLALGLPIAIFFAWAFEMTPEGLKKEKDVDRSLNSSPTSKTDKGRMLDRGIIAVLVVALGYFIWASRSPEEMPVPPSTAATPTIEESGPVAQQAANANSVAVLPFVNMSSDPEQEYFSDGITEEIINAVVKIPGVSVPARTSVFGFKNHTGDVREIGLSLGVAHILEGSVRSQGKQVRITAQLIKVDDGFHLWSETFDRQLENIFVVQEEIAAAIAHALLGELGGSLQTVPNQTRNMEAYDTYLKGRAALRQRQDEAVPLLEQATRADPTFAPALAALAIAYQSVAGDIDQAMSTARKALALDPNNVDALDAMGSTLRSKRRWLEAEQYFDKALAIDPNSAELLEDYAEFLAYVGRTKEALAITTRGMEIDPMLVPLFAAHVEALVSNQRGDEAHELVLDALKRNEESPARQARIYWFALPIVLNPAPEVASLPRIKFPPEAEGESAEVNAVAKIASRLLRDRTDQLAINELKKFYPPGPNATDKVSFDFYIAREALVYAGEIDHVIAADIELLSGDDSIGEFGWAPFFKPLRQHSRFSEFLEKAGLVAYWDATQWPEWCKRDAQGVITCK